MMPNDRAKPHRPDHDVMSTTDTLPPKTPAEAKIGGGVVLQRLVRRNSTETVKHLMFLFGVKAVPHPEFAEAVFVIADKWQEGFEYGMALQKKKPSLFRSIRKILRSKNQPNDKLSHADQRYE